MSARLAAVLAALLTTVLALAACNTSPPPDRIVFSHGPHLARGASCTDCHAAAATREADAPSEDAGAGATPLAHHPAGEHARRLLPSEESCRSCHDDAQRDRCSLCHTSPGAAQGYPEADDDIRFDHAQHAEPGEGACVRCHGGGARSLAAFEAVRPPMETCTNSCHQEQMRALDCGPCHTDLGRYRLGEIALVEHGPGFLRRHGTPARTSEALCAQCHEPTFCSDCHLASPGLPLEVLDPSLVHREFIHRGDYLSRHAIEADLERGTCARCHGTSFCDDCHRLSGVGGSVAIGSPHPPGWLDPLSSFGHARAARRDLLSCVSCHENDAEATCVPCHRVGGVAGNPHPPGFGGGRDPLVHGVCRACHVMR
jgi:hypothetical protein